MTCGSDRVRQRRREPLPCFDGVALTDPLFDDEPFAAELFGALGLGEAARAGVPWRGTDVYGVPVLGDEERGGNACDDERGADERDTGEEYPGVDGAARVPSSNDRRDGCERSCPLEFGVDCPGAR
ncbi:MAG: hypothetical protein EXR75_02365 [Myxococcales bacterium]|nr:hypothetical protein [Myxococcales bacterium]